MDINKYFYQPLPLKEIKDKAIFIIDTNVLLSAYQWRNVTIKEVKKTLEHLKGENRLRVPEQVLIEFAKNRAPLILQRINDIEGELSKIQKVNKSSNELVPLLEDDGHLASLEEKRNLYNDAADNYKDELIKVREKLVGLFREDPFLSFVKNLVENCLITLSEDMDDLNKEAKIRFANKVPPGYKDSGKDENSVGDYIIWKSILSLNKDVVFVSGDTKKDWMHVDSKKTGVSPRRELIEEFFSLTGCNYNQITPIQFVTLFNSDISEAVKKDLNHSLKNDYTDEDKIVFLSESIRDYFYESLTLQDAQEVRKVESIILTLTTAFVKDDYGRMSFGDLHQEIGWRLFRDGIVIGDQELKRLSKNIFMEFSNYFKEVQ